MSSGSSSPVAALAAAETAMVSQFRDADRSRGDRLVLDAFALGWQMAELTHPAAPGATSAEECLPGVSELTADELAQLSVLEVQAGLTKLTAPIKKAGLDVPSTQQLSAAVGADELTRTHDIRQFHVRLLSVLTAADFRLGKAYSLGCTLAESTCFADDWSAAITSDSVPAVAESIRQLASALPAHASHPVADSLAAWSRWGRSPKGHVAASAVTGGKLAAQGLLWRGLLSGEKAPTGVLELADYLRAGEGMIELNLRLAWKSFTHFWWLVLLVILMFAAGVTVIVLSDSGAAIVGGAATVATSIGLGWKGIGTSLGTSAAKLEDPIWQGQLDRVIYERITPQEIVDAQQGHVRGPDEPSLRVAVEPVTDG
jgi:hypothetical protein